VTATPTIVLDTNVLVYLFDGRDPVKQRMARTTVDNLGRLGTASIPAQVLAEFSSVMLRKARRDAKDVADDVDSFRRAFPVLPLTAAVVEEALRGVHAYGLSYYDAQIWAVAHLAQATTVLSEDFNAGARLEGVAFVDPFAGP
jgi:predicted nucleic acid-binding protein